MDRYNWQDRPQHRDDRWRSREDERRSDESRYRGAYRLDTDSRHRNESTYDGFDMDNRGRYRNNEQQGGDYVYRRSRNLQDNDKYTERQYRQSYDDSRGRDNFGSRFGGNAGMSDKRSGDDRWYEERYRRQNRSSFDGDYGPDRYSNRPGENYGNMAGSLSYGYDGDYNADPDYNRRYNPMSGEMRDYSDHITQRPRRYGPPDRTGSNPDYDRY